MKRQRTKSEFWAIADAIAEVRGCEKCGRRYSAWTACLGEEFLVWFFRYMMEVCPICAVESVYPWTPRNNLKIFCFITGNDDKEISGSSRGIGLALLEVMANWDTAVGNFDLGWKKNCILCMKRFFAFGEDGEVQICPDCAGGEIHLRYNGNCPVVHIASIGDGSLDPLPVLACIGVSGNVAVEMRTNVGAETICYNYAGYWA